MLTSHLHRTTSRIHPTTRRSMGPHIPQKVEKHVIILMEMVTWFRLQTRPISKLILLRVIRGTTVDAAAAVMTAAEEAAVLVVGVAAADVIVEAAEEAEDAEDATDEIFQVEHQFYKLLTQLQCRNTSSYQVQ